MHHKLNRSCHDVRIIKSIFVCLLDLDGSSILCFLWRDLIYMVSFSRQDHILLGWDSLHIVSGSSTHWKGLLISVSYVTFISIIPF